MMKEVGTNVKLAIFFFKETGRGFDVADFILFGQIDLEGGFSPVAFLLSRGFKIDPDRMAVLQIFQGLDSHLLQAAVVEFKRGDHGAHYTQGQAIGKAKSVVRSGRCLLFWRSG